MDKKKSVGVTIASIVMLFLSLLCFYISYTFRRVVYDIGLGRQYFDVPQLLYCILWGLTALIYCISSINILRLKDWARTIIIRYSAFIIIILILYILLAIITPSHDPCGKGWVYFFLLYYISPIVLLSLIFLIFFTRPKVKRQFIEPNPKQSEG